MEWFPWWVLFVFVCFLETRNMSLDDIRDIDCSGLVGNWAVQNVSSSIGASLVISWLVFYHKIAGFFVIDPTLMTLLFGVQKLRVKFNLFIRRNSTFFTQSIIFSTSIPPLKLGRSIFICASLFSWKYCAAWCLPGALSKTSCYWLL